MQPATPATCPSPVPTRITPLGVCPRSWGYTTTYKPPKATVRRGLAHLTPRCGNTPLQVCNLTLTWAAHMGRGYASLYTPTFARFGYKLARLCTSKAVVGHLYATAATARAYNTATPNGRASLVWAGLAASKALTLAGLP